MCFGMLLPKDHIVIYASSDARPKRGVHQTASTHQRYTIHSEKSALGKPCDMNANINVIGFLDTMKQVWYLM